MYSSRISTVTFSVDGADQIKESSQVRVQNKDLFKSGLPVTDGIYDPHMGTTDHTWKCQTCHNGKELCPGHYGSIELSYPIQSPLFRVDIIKWLRCICFKCGEPVLGKFHIPGSKSKYLTEYAKLTKGNSSKAIKCQSCLIPNHIDLTNYGDSNNSKSKLDKSNKLNKLNASNGIGNGIGSKALCGEIHPLVTRDKNYPSQIIIEYYEDKLISKSLQLHNHQIEAIFAKVTPETLEYFGKSSDAHPSKFLLRTIRVPPNTIRPDLKRIVRGGRSNNNELTTLLKSIIEFSSKLDGVINDTNINNNKATIDLLEMCYYEFIKGSSATSNKTHITSASKAPLNSIASRIPKKEGRVRSNLMGKRASKMLRSVITGDSNLAVDEVIIPVSIAREMQIPETVQSYNYERMLIYFNNKRNYPGCTKIIKRSNGAEYWVNSNVQLEIGDILYRDYITGDILPINRQPSLTFSSISSHKVIVVDSGDTIRINVSACSYYNADFDGDQMNGLIPSSLMARIEAQNLSWCGRWFISYANSDPMVGAYQDGLIGLYELTQNTTRFTPKHAMAMMSKTNVVPDFTKIVSLSANPNNMNANIKSVNLNANYADLGVKKLSGKGKGKSNKKIQDDDKNKIDGKAESTINFNHIKLGGSFANKKLFTGRDIVSLVLPPINITKKPKFYNESFEPFIDYSPEDTMVEIDRGMLKRGILDKSTVGQGQHGTIFQIIHNEYGPRKAFDTVYALQKLAENFFFQHGFTVSTGDMLIPQDALDKIHGSIDNLLFESRLITEQLNNGLLIPPIGSTLEQFYEEKQINALFAGDDFIKPIMENTDPDTNNIYKIIFSGSKGDTTNLMAVSAAIGQTTIGGLRLRQQFGFKRSSPYYHRFDPDPVARGFIPENYINGIKVQSFISSAMDGRYAIISNALQTSVTGDQNRTCIKNLESIIIDNLRKAVKNTNIVQYLYGEDGMDPRKMEKVKIPHVMMSWKDFEERYSSIVSFAADKISSKDSKSDKTVVVSKLSQLLKEEFETLTRDRELYRKIFLKLEGQKINNFGDIWYSPVNVQRIIDDTLYKFSDKNSQGMYDDGDKINLINKVKEICETMPYLLINEIQEKKRIALPSYINKSVTMICILIRSHLYLKNMIKLNITEKILDIIYVKIRMQYIKAIMDCGTAIGTIAAQSAGEPVTQGVLNSKHRAGTVGSSTSGIVRLKEIYGARPTHKMKQPTMILAINPKAFPDNANGDTMTDEERKNFTQLIANKVEMMPFKRFVDNIQVFFEDYNEIKHPNYKHEKAMFAEFAKYNIGIKPPGDLIKWCIRVELNKFEMIMKNMDLDTILIALRNNFNYIFVINTPENVDNIVLRIYMRNIFSKKTIEIDDVVRISNEVLDFVVRGVQDLTYTQVGSKTLSKIDPVTQAIVTKTEYVIHTNGTNLAKTLEVPELDHYNLNTDSILEIAEIYGIEAARMKYHSELKMNIAGLNARHYMLFADEVTYTGHVTAISRVGLTNREGSVLLNVSNSFAIQALQNAALENKTCHVTGLSAPLMVGSVGMLGSLYNTIVLNEEFIAKQHNILNDL
jgi:DNA-directed RNA polymerase beta' subunit